MGEAVIRKTSDWNLGHSAVEISSLWTMSETIDHSKVALKPNHSTQGGQYESQ